MHGMLNNQSVLRGQQQLILSRGTSISVNKTNKSVPIVSNQVKL